MLLLPAIITLVPGITFKIETKLKMNSFIERKNIQKSTRTKGEKGRGQGRGEKGGAFKNGEGTNLDRLLLLSLPSRS